MRASLAIASLVWLLLAGLPITIAQPEDAGDNPTIGDDGEDDATQIADQVEGTDGDEEASVPSPPMTKLDQEPTAGPAEPQEANQVSMPGKVGLATGLSRFGSHEQPSITKPVNMAASLDAFGKKEKKEEKKKAKAPTKEAQAEADATNAHIAAETAKTAAKVAFKVATHTSHVTENAKSALKGAQDALHKARVESRGLSKSNRQSLKDAENKLGDATRSTDMKKAKAQQAQEAKEAAEAARRQAMKEKMEKLKKESKKKRDGELEAMRKEIEDLRKQLKNKEGDEKDGDAMLKDLQDQIEEMEKKEKKDNKQDKKHHDEMKAEIERLRAQIEDMDNQKSVTYEIPKEEKKEEAKGEEKVAKLEKAEENKVEKDEDVEKYNVHMKPLSESDEEENKEEHNEHEHLQGDATPVESKGIDIDTAMPYGDLEPFGREDTAQELTESSIKESDEMVDQLERAEVAEEKRSVFRALTRLRGAAITSFDGVARSQTGNIDEYNKIHQWRNTHPLHHLADEESDISKWAFPDNAD